uniref:Peptidase n=1 Tax=Angiostrongylus cantonensis TaxID=6313 RepID=A0A0K0DI90_ANGCA
MSVSTFFIDRYRLARRARLSTRGCRFGRLTCADIPRHSRPVDQGARAAAHYMVSVDVKRTQHDLSIDKLRESVIEICIANERVLDRMNCVFR